MPFNLLLLPLLGGYWFVNLAHCFKYSVARQPAQQLLLTSATAGVALAFVSWGVVTAFILACPTCHEIWRSFLPWNFSGTAIGSLLLGPLAAFIVNLFVDQETAEERAIENEGNGLERLFARATKASKQVLLTMESGKVYVGWIVRMPPDPRSENAYVRILPTMSGYRDEKHRIQFTTMYDEMYEKMLSDDQISAAEEEELKDFLKSIPLSKIQSAGIFDPEIYRAFNKDGEPEKNQSVT